MAAKIRAITLDLDNTLWDVFPTLRKAEQNSHRFLSEHFPRVAERFSADDISALRDRIYSNYLELQHDMTGIRRRLYVEMLKECDYDPVNAEDLLNRFLVDRNKVELYPDALPALKRLANSYPLISLSDGNANLSSIGIRDFFVGCVYSADTGYAKPHCAGFEKACEIAGVEPGEIVHVGDNPIADVDGARRAGFQTMWIQRNEEIWTEDFEPDYSVKTMLEAVEILC